MDQIFHHCSQGTYSRVCNNTTASIVVWSQSVCNRARKATNIHVSSSSFANPIPPFPFTAENPKKTYETRSGDSVRSRKLRLSESRERARKNIEEGDRARYALTSRLEITLGRVQTERRRSTVVDDVDKRKAELRSGDAIYGGNHAEERENSE